MTSEPKTQEELEEAIAKHGHDDWDSFDDFAKVGVLGAIRGHLDAIASLGLAVVPLEPTEEMVFADIDNRNRHSRDRIRAAIAAGNLAKGETDG